MKIYFDEKADALLFCLDESKKVVDSQEVQKGIVLDFDAAGDVVGIEILKVQQRVPSDQLKQFKSQVA